MAPRLSPFKDVLRAATRPSQAGLRRSLVRLPAESPLDEETLPHYDPQQFYPVRIGDVFDERYQVSGKLGYGAYSTSWLCRDMKYIVTQGQGKNLADPNQKPALRCAESINIASKFTYYDRS